MAGSTRFVEAIHAQGINPDVRVFPDGTRTAADAARAVGVEVGQIVKSLVFIVDSDPLLILTSGANRVDEDRVARILKVPSIEKATAEQARRATGFAIGGTPPFGHAQPLRTLLDRDLLTYELVWAAAGTPETCFPIAPARLREITGAEIVDVSEPHGA